MVALQKADGRFDHGLLGATQKSQCINRKEYGARKKGASCRRNATHGKRSRPEMQAITLR